jgi:GMP synthase-like glutamine amidotransferase
VTRIAILETGQPPAKLKDRFGDYPGMFTELLGDGFEIDRVDVQAQAPPEPERFGGAIITGSPAGVYEDDAWIGRLLEWIGEARGRTRLVGVCFGHQAMAQALGGRVEKSDRGWGVGLHQYDVVSTEPWMASAPPTIAIPVSHQDQVVERPSDARVTIRSAFAPYAGLAWGEDAISFQCHPEFSPAFAEALVQGRRGRIEDAVVDRAVESLKAPNDNALVGAWIRGFLAG